MIIELQNFGPIKSFKFDTSKDMYAIFGKNNIGKSYAISAVYLILKGLRDINGNKEVINSFANEYKQDDIFPELKKLLEVKNKFDITFNITNVVTAFWRKTFLEPLEISFRNTFFILQNFKTNNSFKIFLKFNNSTIEISEIGKELFISQLQSFDVEDFTLEVSSLKTEKERLSMYSVTDERLIMSSHDTKSILHSCLEKFLNSLDFPNGNIYYLPASRSGLYNALNSFGAIFAELSRNRNFIRHKFEIPNIAEPISDYFLNLNTIDKAQANEHYLTHFEEIEQDILKGKITLDNETKKYYYVPTDTDMRLELSFTSSMISEIAPIIAHLKYIIPLESDKPSILFIEEPEAHLHPEIQILLLEYFVKLSKGNVKIVMTSHSNYIFNKLSNLLIANKIDKNKLSVSLMKMTPEGSVIEEGAMQMDEYGIEDNNFVDVAEQLYEERMSLLEKL